MGEVVLFAASSKLGRQHKNESENSAWPNSVRVVSKMSVRGCIDFFAHMTFTNPLSRLVPSPIALPQTARLTGVSDTSHEICVSTSLCVCEGKLALE